MQVYVSLRYWHLRAERFALLARTSVTQNVSRALAPVAAALLLPGWLGLAAGETAGRGVGLTPLFTRLGGDFRRFAVRSGVRRMAAGMRRYAVFAVLGVPSGLLNALAQALPLPLLAAGFGAEAAGQFALAQRVLQAPLALVGRNAADAFHARLAIHVRERPAYARAFFLKTTLVLLAAALVPAAAVVLAGPRGFGWVFGARWAPAGELAVAMLPWATASLVVTPLSRSVFVLGGQRGKLVYDVAAVALVAGACAAAQRLGWTLSRTVLVLSSAQALAYMIYFAVLLRIVRGARAPVPAGAAE
jgi:hypothetical protein